jgi:hypothetical protein
MDWISEHWQELVAAVGGLVIAARVMVKLTPTPADDRWLAKVVKVLKHVGLYIPVMLTMALLASCTVAVGPDGKPVFGTDPEGVRAIADAVAERVNESLREGTK